MSKNKITTKGKTVTTPRGKALWCKNVEPERKFNKDGDLMTSLVLDPNDKDVEFFIKELEDLRGLAFAEAQENFDPAKAKELKERPVFQNETDKDGNETGNILVKLKLGNVDVKKEEGRQHEIITVDAKTNVIKNPPQVGNGSTIRCSAYANPYYMASSKEIGVSLAWQKMQILDLVTIGGEDAFESEDGYTSEEVEALVETAPF